MAKEDTNDAHIHATHEKSYGHLHKKGGDHHLNKPGRGETQGPEQPGQM
jgi:hypothetical protein